MAPRNLLSARHWSFDSPVGLLRIVVDPEGRLMRLDFMGELARFRPPELPGDPDPDATRHVSQQLDEYFRGERKSFELQLAPAGTPFQHQVWAKVREIPYGETRTYGQLAVSLAGVGASRAVGRANATNPIPIVVPCHRVIGSSGALTGFGGGLPCKDALLRLERGELGSLFDD